MLQNIKKQSKHIFFFMIGFYSLGLGIFVGKGDQYIGPCGRRSDFNLLKAIS
jgi:hypothetical protein